MSPTVCNEIKRFTGHEAQHIVGQHMCWTVSYQTCIVTSCMAIKKLAVVGKPPEKPQTGHNTRRQRKHSNVGYMLSRMFGEHVCNIRMLGEM